MPFGNRALLMAALLGVGMPAMADELAPVFVEESLPLNPNAAEPDDYNRIRAVSADGGDFLRQLNGVSASRFGGRGIEPIIRGQSQTRLNVLLDGAYVHGGCPNRMDPPSSWAALETYERVIVLKGVQTLLYGGGGSGGTVLFERDTASLAEQKGVHGRLSALGSDNGIASDMLGDVVMAGDEFYLRVFAEEKNGNNYEDGGGREVRAAFNHGQGGLVLGYRPGGQRLMELTVEKNDFEDALYPGAGMDSPEESGNFYRFRYRDRPENGVDEFSLDVYISDVDHLMDNYSDRTAPPYPAGTPMAGKPMLRAAPTNSTTSGGRLLLTSEIGMTTVDWGLDVQRNERTATLDSMDGGSAVTLSYLWPDVTISQVGLFAEASTELAEDALLKYGLRVDRVDASAERVADKPKLVAPNMAYQTYYGVTADDRQETNIGALLRYEKDLREGLTVFSGFSRSVRTADATERYVNKWNSNAAMRWVGNPDIGPEKHHQLDLGITVAGKARHFSAVLFYDRVTDYILRDAARGQAGILQADGADIYRNIDAEFHGAELEGGWSPGKNLELSASLAWVRATNSSDDRPIPQTPPLNGKIQLDYAAGRWGVGSRLRFADRQDRVDMLSKQEVGETAAWQVLDLYGNYRFNKTFSLRAGADNVFDRRYAEHASRSNLLDPVAVKVNEPGRTLWAKLTAEF